MILVQKQRKRSSGYYKSIGFMCGLEIHQRLATKEKLFCSCRSSPIDKSAREADAAILRYQRAVAGELGAIDISAKFEELRNRAFRYNVFEENTCLVDIDEEPPHEINMEALEIALSFAKAMKMKILDELEPMRKEVVDGSDPGAFQRSLLVALDGSLKVDGVRVNVPSIFLEEESCGIGGNADNLVVYNTDRYGIPLVEVDTDAGIPTPTAAKEIALYIGTLMRVSGRVQRGIGSIRQDVNMSIKGGARVEIKGVQEVALIDRYVENEIVRQQRLIEIKEKLIKLKARAGAAKDATRIFRNTNANVIKAQIEKGGIVLALALKGFKSFLGFEINPDIRLGTEISEYARKAGVHGLIHGDENLKGYGFGEAALEALRKELGLEENDSFILIAGTEDKAKRAMELARWRAEYSLKGVPLETRVAFDNTLFTSKFLRPLPTGSRMYPETDVKPIVVGSAMLDKAARMAPNIEKERGYIESKIRNAAIVEQLILSQKLPLFKLLLEKTAADPEFVANILLQKFTELKRSGIDVDNIDYERLVELFRVYEQGAITKHAIEPLLKAMAKRNEHVEKLVSGLSLERITGSKLKKLVDEIEKELKGKKLGREKIRDAIMAKYRLNVDGEELNKLL